MLFIYDIENSADLQEEIAKALACRSVIAQSLSSNTLRHAVRVMTHHDKLIVPTAIGQCTPLVERMRSIAHTLGIDVVNLTAYLAQAKNQPKTTRPVAAVAAPPTQQPVAAGKHTVHP